MKRITTTLFVLLLTGLVLGGCQFNLVSYERSKPGHLENQYLFMDGAQSTGFDAGSGQVFRASYSTSVRAGALRLSLRGPDGAELWSEDFTQDGSGTAEVALPADGGYTLTVNGARTSGGFQLDWSVQ